MIQRIIRLLRPAAILTAACLLAACTDDNTGKTGGDGEATIELTLKMPATTGGTATRAITGQPLEENNIDPAQIDVLAFIQKGSDWVYDYTATFKTITDTGTPNNTDKTITATVRVLPVQQMFAVFANSSTEVAGIGYIIPGTKIEDVERKIICSTGGGEWPARNNGSGAFTPFPMYARTGAVTITSGPNTIGAPEPMIRMVARIDVTLKASILPANFVLTEACLYNRMTSGYVSYVESGFDGLSAVTVPAVPTPSGWNTGTPPLANTVMYAATGINEIKNAIYAFEAAAITTEAEMTEKTALVIGGNYNGSLTKSYYRVDLKTTADLSTNISSGILRNHLYEVEVQSVAGAGYPTATEAYMGNARLIATVKPWDLADHGIIRDEQFFLRTEINSEEMPGKGGTHTLKAETDYNISSRELPAGIWIEDSEIEYTPAVPFGSEWITLTDVLNTNGGLTRTVELSAPANHSGADRSAKVYVKAGNIVKELVIEQTGKFIAVTDMWGNPISELIFASNINSLGVNPTPQQFKVEWRPTTETVSIAYTPGTYPFTWQHSSYGLTSLPAGGSYTYTTIDPLGISPADTITDPFMEKTVRLDFTTVSAGPEYIDLKQVYYNVIPVVEAEYWMDGTTKSFVVKCNTEFTVSLKSNPSGVITSLPSTTYPANTAGTNVYFNIIDDLTTPSIYQKTAIVTIKSPQGLFPDRDVTLECISPQPESNSYIVAPGGAGILIPVSRTNASLLGAQLGASETFTTELVWTDNANKIAPNSNISYVGAIGTGSSGYVKVVPGTATGNAVVAIKNSSNVILWSWHIWVTSYAPTGAAGTFMDRNLGALDNTPGAVDTKGLFYQWGRKDPFPGSTTVTTNVEPTLYTASGTVAVAKVAIPVASNFANSVANPLTYYFRTTTPYDWYSTGTLNDALWGGGSTKTEYDPCPEGWRVPSFSGSTSPWAALTNTTFPWVPLIYGRENAAHGGYYPASGVRGYSTGALSGSSTSGYYWTASPTTSVNAYYMLFNSGSVTPASATGRAYGCSVRCVKE